MGDRGAHKSFMKISLSPLNLFNGDLRFLFGIKSASAGRSQRARKKLLQTIIRLYSLLLYFFTVMQPLIAWILLSNLKSNWWPLSMWKVLLMAWRFPGGHNYLSGSWNLKYSSKCGFKWLLLCLADVFILLKAFKAFLSQDISFSRYLDL